MNRGNFLRQALLVFGVALTGYAVLFAWIGHRRVVKGPWTVTFTVESESPVLIVNQLKLGLRDVRIVFADERAATNLTRSVDFAQPRMVPFEVPFGRCVFFDPLFLPGTVALEIHGHEIQLLPRVLTIDKVERPWQSGETIQIREPSAPR